MHWWSDPGWNPGESSRLWGRQLKRPDGRKCWAGNEVLQGVDGWLNAGAAECQHRRPERSSPTGPVVCSRWTVSVHLKNTRSGTSTLKHPHLRSQTDYFSNRFISSFTVSNSGLLYPLVFPLSLSLCNRSTESIPWIHTGTCYPVMLTMSIELILHNV